MPRGIYQRKKRGHNMTVPLARDAMVFHHRVAGIRARLSIVDGLLTEVNQELAVFVSRRFVPRRRTTMSELARLLVIREDYLAGHTTEDEAYRAIVLIFADNPVGVANAVLDSWLPANIHATTARNVDE